LDTTNGSVTGCVRCNSNSWKRGSKIYLEMRRFGLPEAVAAQAAAVNKRWWSRAAKLVHAGLTARYYDQMGVPRLAG